MSEEWTCFVWDGVIITMYEGHLDPLKQQLADAMRFELDLMTQWGVLGEIIPAGIDGADMEASMKRLSNSSDLVFMTKLSGGSNIFKV